VAIVGAGGLGCPVALYLAAAGVGQLTLIDSDVVADSNLHRQILFSPADVGRAKVEAAAAALGVLAPRVNVTPVTLRLTPGNAAEALAGHHVIVDATDTFASRLTVADAAAELGVPVAWGAVQGWFGQVTVFDGTVGLRDIFPVEPPPDFGVCDAGGVLGTLCGQVGTAMATEAVKLLTGVGVPLTGVLSVIDAREGRWRDLDVRRADAAEG
jgi:adenylyltransferase/sulfurtransferase